MLTIYSSEFLIFVNAIFIELEIKKRKIGPIFLKKERIDWKLLILGVKLDLQQDALYSLVTKNHKEKNQLKIVDLERKLRSSAECFALSWYEEPVNSDLITPLTQWFNSKFQNLGGKILALFEVGGGLFVQFRSPRSPTGRFLWYWWKHELITFVSVDPCKIAKFYGVTPQLFEIRGGGDSQFICKKTRVKQWKNVFVLFSGMLRK